jgi:SSS family solute:Na+ symporter/sodium/proline symporter
LSIAAVVLVLTTVTFVKTREYTTKTDFLLAGAEAALDRAGVHAAFVVIGGGELIRRGENAYRNGFAALWQPLGDGWG